MNMYIFIHMYLCHLHFYLPHSIPIVLPNPSQFLEFFFFNYYCCTDIYIFTYMHTKDDKATESI